MKNPKLKAPSYKIISSTAMSNQGNSLTLIDLGKNATIKSILKDDIIATGKINSKDIEFKALENTESGVSEIYALIPGINHKGSISLTIKSDIVSTPITINEDDCYYIYSLYYGENFDSMSSVSDFCKTEKISATFGKNTNNGRYIQSSSTSNNGKFYSIVDLNIPTEGSYLLEFDASIANANVSNSSSFYILTEQSNTDSYLLKMTSNTYNNGNNNMTWIINNDSETTVTFTSNFVHFKIIVDRVTNEIALSIYSMDDKVILDKQKIIKSSSATTDIAKSFYMSLCKGTRGCIKLTNISVYSYENAEIIVPFKQKEIKISLESYLKSIINIENKSIYCTSSFSNQNLEVTFKSLKQGKTYMYFNGILNTNDNKALVLVIVTIDERGYISYDENIYIFSDDSSLNKVPSTIQKEFNTSTFLGDLDTSEPEDNPNITPRVDVDELNSKFSEFDSENSIKTKIKIAFCINNNKWSILYIKDTEIDEYSEFILYDNFYDGFLDCVNASFGLLTSGRTTKEKISIITSGSTRSASKNPNSIVKDTNRMNTSVAIKCSSYVILDFEENYIYIDNTEKLKKDSKEYGLDCLIDMERGIKYSTICNLNLFGMQTYGIFVAGSSFILFKNIKMLIAQGENRSVSIGIRVQSQDNAIANVALSRWSHDIYFDNCSFNGLNEHGIETFNAYNIYMTTINITDVGGCGVLLNCSYNAWINRIIGKRCCAGDTYATVRFANDVGPNINIHYVYGEACGNGVFLASSSNDIYIDKINLINIHSTPIYVGGSAGLHIQSGKIISNGGEIKFSTFKGETSVTKATTGGGIFLVGGSSSQFLPQWNNVFENIIIDGFNCGYTERYNMSSNYNIYNNIDTTGCKKIKNADGQGTGTEEDIGFGFCVIDGMKGPGNEIITGDIIPSGDYSYALNSDSTSYILMEYSGIDTNIITPKKFKGKPISRIGSFAFYGNKNLMSITITSNIKSLGGLSFGNCTSLKNLKFMKGGEYEIGHCAFRGCSKLDKVDLTGVRILRASSFAWCKNLRKLVCPKNVVYFGSNCFYNDNIDLTIECDDISLMTVEPYAFYFIGFESKIKFTGISKPTNVIGVSATANGYYYNSHSYVERKVYKPGVWCKYYYHVAVTPTFKE